MVFREGFEQSLSSSVRGRWGDAKMKREKHFLHENSSGPIRVVVVVVVLAAAVVVVVVLNNDIKMCKLCGERERERE